MLQWKAVTYEANLGVAKEVDEQVTWGATVGPPRLDGTAAAAGSQFSSQTGTGGAKAATRPSSGSTGGQFESVPDSYKLLDKIMAAAAGMPARDSAAAQADVGGQVDQGPSSSPYSYPGIRRIEDFERTVIDESTVKQYTFESIMFSFVLLGVAGACVRVPFSYWQDSSYTRACVRCVQGIE